MDIAARLWVFVDAAMSRAHVLALQDQSIFQIVFSHLEKLYLLRSVQFVSTYFYAAIPDLIEALDSCVVSSLVATKNALPTASERKRNQTRVSTPGNCTNVLETLVSLGARCRNLRVVDFGNHTQMTNAQLSRALACCSGKLEAINLARCLKLTWLVIEIVSTQPLQ